MALQRQHIASAVLTALAAWSVSAAAQTADSTAATTNTANTANTANTSATPAAQPALQPIVVTATPFASEEDVQVLAPAKVITGDELRNKLGNSLGDTLSNELGVSASAFGAGASRPIIRGMEGPRVMILQNGMDVSDVSTVSNDHAVATEAATARQIEILRGPAALLYGSGAIGGLVNVVNDRIPTELVGKPTGTVEGRYGTVDGEKNSSFSLDTSAGQIGLHLDGNYRDTDNYKIPGNVRQGDSSSASGRLPNSFTHETSLGAGISYVTNWGYIGLSAATLDDHYGIPTDEMSFIDLHQNRYDLDTVVNQPFAGIEKFRVRMGYTDYTHIEKAQDGTPNTVFSNRSQQTRWELTHAPLAGWHGTFGVQTEQSNYSALTPDTGVSELTPPTRSSSFAGFLVEERQFGQVLASAGLRAESVSRRPDSGSGLPGRNFSLISWSTGGLWSFQPGYGLGLTYSFAQRAPTVEELYSNGPHESTSTYDIGDNQLKKETSHNIELSLQKTEGLVRWKGNVFRNKVNNYIYGRTNGQVDDTGTADANGEFTQRFWSQGDATIRGVEAEVTYNWNGEGVSGRVFADTSRGTLDNQGNLPLQPATRYGIELGYKTGPWASGVKVLRAQKQDRLASFETYETPSYTQLDANLSYTQRLNGVKLTWFALARNLLNQDIRLSTSVLRETVPLGGRNFIVGVRTAF
ncbi:TonB-dependent heme/hemoglobin receptor protein [Herbaspirillum sp. GW103]|uniref:TonB-dependent receptor n=1 Tax=Herbaspirillum sp. GW103 TaxID=1175306 RepID=UPI00025E3EA4|nr:TonB-dependent receptor [Herbaspirillum sp. GW103]EIJ44909.1 TonB-dependent heme/hemoglobin receptor protein [Herbaspirillum sp. GW103]